MKYVYIGKFNGTHGLRGEIKLKSNFDYIDKVLTNDFPFYIGKEKTLEKLNTNRYHNGHYLVSFKGLDDIDLIKKYVNNNVYILRSDLSIGSNYVIEDLIGLKACYLNKEIGIIKDIVDTGSKNRIFVIEGAKEILVPYNENFIDSVESTTVNLKNVEGFINEN